MNYSNTLSLDSSVLLSFKEGDFHVVDDDSRLPYQHLKFLSNGHTAVVDKVQDKITQGIFARKTFMIPTARKAKRANERTFRNEIEVIRSLSPHHHVVRVFAAYETDRNFCILLQPAADQGDLSWFLEKYTILSNSARSGVNSDAQLQPMREVLEQSFGCLASGLAFMHQQKIRHKDIKPQNILVHEDSVLYTDFGYSLDSSQSDNSMTYGKPHTATKKYAAPEVQDHDERNSLTDVYSLGCVFLEIFSALAECPGLLPKEKAYSSNLKSIHEGLAKVETSGKLSFLPIVITSTTAWNRTDRPTAKEILKDTINQPGFCCKKCQWSQGIIENTRLNDKVCLDTDMTRMGLEQDISAQRAEDDDSSRNYQNSEQNRILNFDQNSYHGAKLGNVRGTKHLGVLKEDEEESQDEEDEEESQDEEDEENSLDEEDEEESQVKEDGENQRIREISSEDIHTALVQIACTKLTPGEKGGCIFIACSPHRPGFTKIVSTRNSDYRWRPMLHSCGEPLDLIGMYPIEHYRRVERLISIELRNLQERSNCLRCNMRHYQWFRIEGKEAIRIVTMWVTWLNEEKPYQQNKELDPWWESRIQNGSELTRNFGVNDHEARRQHWRRLLSPPANSDRLLTSTT